MFMSNFEMQSKTQMSNQTEMSSKTEMSSEAETHSMTEMSSKTEMLEDIAEKEYLIAFATLRYVYPLNRYKPVLFVVIMTHVDITH